MNLKDEVFGLKGKDALMHEAVLNHLANQRQGTHATKTKGLVRGGGKKPYKQKHTGRARAGSIRSPLWKGGGTIFGPQPRDYRYSMPRQAKKVALHHALSRKFAEGDAVVVDSLKMDGPKTKEMAGLIKVLGIGEKSLLIVTGQRDEGVRLSARNIPGVMVKIAEDINAYDVLSHERLLFTSEAVERLQVKA